MEDYQMHLNAKRPVFVPQEYWAEIEQHSKAALMDMVWDFAAQNTEPADATGPSNGEIMETLRKRASIITHHRK